MASRFTGDPVAEIDAAHWISRATLNLDQNAMERNEHQFARLAAVHTPPDRRQLVVGLIELPGPAQQPGPLHPGTKNHGAAADRVNHERSSVDALGTTDALTANTTAGIAEASLEERARTVLRPVRPR